MVKASGDGDISEFQASLINKGFAKSKKSAKGDGSSGGSKALEIGAKLAKGYAKLVTTGIKVAANMINEAEANKGE